MIQAFSSPNRLVWLFADTARVLGSEAESADTPQLARSKAVAAIVMAVASVEAYLNAQAKLLLFRDKNHTHRARIESDLRRKTSLGRKLEEWPLLMYGAKAELGMGPGQKFKVTLDKRNALMHFISDVHEVEVTNLAVQGLFDTTAVENIEPMNGWDAVVCAEDFVEYLLKLSGVSAEQIPHAMHHWIGRVPPRAA